ncbi:MAG: hypothetical protein WAM39_15655 [Bryobacteraceae bacterium]
MASFWERVQNALEDNEKRDRRELERIQARREGYERALYEVRDALLVSALAVKNEWQSQLARDGDRIRSGTDARFVAQFEGLNAAFAVLRQMEPRITTQIHIDQFRQAAISGAECLRQAEAKISHNVTASNGYATNHLGVNQSEYKRGYDEMRERLDRNLSSALNRMPFTPDSSQTAALERRIVHDLALRASRDVRDNWGDRGRGPERLDHSDYDQGQRKALMDWSHEHNHQIIQKMQAIGLQLEQRNDDTPRAAQRIRL